MRTSLRSRLIVCAASALLMLAMVSLSLAESYPFIAKANAKVNMRKAASSTAAILQQVPKDAQVTVTGSYGSYYKVTYNGKNGYVLKSFLDSAQAAVKVTSTPRPTAIPTAVPASDVSAAGYVTLQRGSVSGAVKALESALAELKFFSGTPNNTFDSATENAVKAFQSKNSLSATGSADANMQAFLYYGKPLNASGKATKVYTLAPLDSVVMHLNNKGDLVVTVQTKLKELGYYSGTISGVYNSATISAVRSFQKKHGLTANGACDEAMRNILLSGSALPAKGTATPKATKTPKPTATPKATSTPKTTVKNGSRGTDASLVQQRLKDLGYFTGKVDGNFGNDSVNALKDFQTANGLTADGILGSGSRSVLFGSNVIARATATPKATKTAKPTATPKAATTPSTVVALNSRGNDAKLVQQRLKALGYFTGTVDGIFGNASVAALKVFQQVNGLGADGIADEYTNAVLFSANAISMNQGGIPTTQTLKKGSAGSAVKALQERLIELGYLEGIADGSFGTSTYNALKSFQSNNGLPEDGVAGVGTINALNSSSAVPAPTAKPVPTPVPGQITVKASDVIYANFYTKVRPVIRQYQYATVYDYVTGASWQIHMFSFGNHAEYEPVTAADTAAMIADFGGSSSWTPKPVWVLLANGQVYIATIHSVPHGVQHDKDNNFKGHACLHFPRTAAQVKRIGPYATSHQKAVDAAWEVVQEMAENE